MPEVRHLWVDERVQLRAEFYHGQERHVFEVRHVRKHERVLVMPYENMRARGIAYPPYFETLVGIMNEGMGATYSLPDWILAKTMISSGTYLLLTAASG